MTHLSAPDLVGVALDQVPADTYWLPDNELRALPGFQAILKGDEAVRRACLVAIVTTDLGTHPSGCAVSLAKMIARTKLALTFDDVQRLFVGRVPMSTWVREEILGALSRQIVIAFPTFSDEERATLVPIFKRVAPHLTGGAGPRLLDLTTPAEGIPLELIAKDPFGALVRHLLTNSAEPAGALSMFVKALASYPTSGRPSKSWRTGAGAAVSALQDPRQLLGDILEAAMEASDAGTYEFLKPENEAFLCGGIACIGLGEDGSLSSVLRRLAVKCVSFIGGEYGFPRSLRAANTAAQAIADTGAENAITELLALERSVRHGTLRKQVRKAIESLAEAQGITSVQLLERAVEAHDLDSEGVRRLPLGSGTAVVSVTNRAATMTYEDEHGTAHKALPTTAKDVDPDGLSEVRAVLKAIRTTIAGERARFDAILSQARSWGVEEWHALYLDHPITGRLSRTLIWRFGTGAAEEIVGIPASGDNLVVSSGSTMPVPRTATVSLWHPASASADEVSDWRRYLLDHQVVQPIKQAFREVYVVTPAEIETRVYSNRFAGHVFRQVQARALMKGRGWQPVAVAWWDDGIDHGIARRTYEDYGFRVEFFFDPILDMEPDGGDLYPYCTSDQARFYRLDSDVPADIADVPAVVFTEAMRDIDLFIGVTSIGADPEWLDRGEDRPFETYWHSYSFGDLTEAAKIRRDIVADLVPRLAIADRCDLEERYLRVRGDLREYRIHLGSGNILMSPNDEYLCIVAARSGATSKLFLPFDDDPTLSVILSKAFMLAADTKITDPTIVAQIKR